MKPLGMALGVRISYLIQERHVNTTLPPSIKYETEERSRASPLSELLEDDAVWKTLSAYADPLQDAVTPQLIQDQVGVQFTGLQQGKGGHVCESEGYGQKSKSKWRRLSHTDKSFVI